VVDDTYRYADEGQISQQGLKSNWFSHVSPSWIRVICGKDLGRLVQNVIDVQRQIKFKVSQGIWWSPSSMVES
jgi:hypothetical protein